MSDAGARKEGIHIDIFSIKNSTIAPVLIAALLDVKDELGAILIAGRRDGGLGAAAAHACGFERETWRE